MFVEIAAKDEPYQAMIETLKSSTVATATALGSAFSSAFTSASGVIGLAIRAVEGLISLVDESSDDVQTLGSYWEEALTPVKAAANDVVGEFTKWTTEMIKASGGIEAVQKTISESIETIKVAVDRGVEVFFDLKARAEEAFTSIISFAGETHESLMNAFGGAPLAAVVAFGESIQTNIVDSLATAGRVVRNFPEYFQLAGIEIAETAINIGEYFQTIPENLSRIGNYIQNNWRQLVVDAVNAVGTAFQNLGTNLSNLSSAIYQWAQNPLKGFKFEWKDLLSGFEATADKMPELMKPVLSSLENQKQAIRDVITAREAALVRHKAKDFEGGDDVAKAAQGDAFKSATLGVAEFQNKLRAGIYDKDKEKIPTEQLKEAKEANKHLEKIANKKGGAILG